MYTFVSQQATGDKNTIFVNIHVSKLFRGKKAEGTYQLLLPLDNEIIN